MLKYNFGAAISEFITFSANRVRSYNTAFFGPFSCRIFQVSTLTKTGGSMSLIFGFRIAVSRILSQFSVDLSFAPIAFRQFLGRTVNYILEKWRGCTFAKAFIAFTFKIRACRKKIPVAKTPSLQAHNKHSPILYCVPFLRNAFGTRFEWN